MSDQRNAQMDIPIQFKSTLRSLRVKFRYTQEGAASLFGVSVPTLREWEKDSTSMPYDKVKKAEEIYGISDDYIFLGNEVAFSELLRKQISLSA